MELSSVICCEDVFVRINGTFWPDAVLCAIITKLLHHVKHNDSALCDFFGVCVRKQRITFVKLGFISASPITP